MADDLGRGAAFADPNPGIPDWYLKASRQFNHNLDKSIPWANARWGAFAVFLIYYVQRVYYMEGYYVVSYGLGIYLLNCVLGFLSPMVDPDEEDGAPMLPTSTDDGEFRPFVRRLPEFQFWRQGMTAVLSSIVMTFFAMFDLPVFWPILLGYFILLVMFTMKQRIKHMIDHKYIPFSVGKQTYGQMTKINATSSKNSE